MKISLNEYEYIDLYYDTIEARAHIIRICQTIY
jgi:hypothetical protein